ncbi:MAG: ABC transporter permease [Thermoproteota archaeon]
MNLSELFDLAFASLRERKLRSALTILGLVIGPAVIVALVGVTQGFSLAVAEQFSKMGVTTILVIPASQKVKLSSNDVQRIQRIHDVVQVAPFYRIIATLKHGGKSTGVIIMGIETEKLQSLFPGIRVSEGRIPLSKDVSGALIGHSLASPTDPEAKPIKIFQVITVQIPPQRTEEKMSSRSFLVEGSLASFGQGLFINPDDTIFIPLTAGRALTKSIYFSGVFVIASGPEKVDGIIDNIINYYGDDVRVIAVSSILSIVQTITSGITIILSSVASISVIVAFIGIMTTMFTTVIERTKEIGLLKALGFKGRDILMVFLSESILTGILGGIVGASLGYVLSYGIIALLRGGIGFNFQEGQFRGMVSNEGDMGFRGGMNMLDFSPVIGPELLLTSILMAIGVGALAGLIPAWRASKLDPVVALRKE